MSKLVGGGGAGTTAEEDDLATSLAALNIKSMGKVGMLQSSKQEADKIKKVRRRTSLAPATKMKHSNFVGSLLQLKDIDDEDAMFAAMTEGSKDGKLSLESLKKALAVIGIDDDLLVVQMFLALKPTLNLEVAKMKLNMLIRGTMQDVTRFIFDVYDTNHDGFVDAEEFAKVLLTTMKQKAKNEEVADDGMYMSCDLILCRGGGTYNKLSIHRICFVSSLPFFFLVF